jgi:hypothetical protein
MLVRSLDPAKMQTLEMGAAGTVLAARLFFEDDSLRETALKLARLIEGAASPSRPYFEALGVVLAHELARLNAGFGAGKLLCEGVSRDGSSALSPPISMSTLPSRYRSPGLPTWSVETVLFLSRVQAVLRPAAAPISQQPAHVGGQDFWPSPNSRLPRLDCRV